MKGGLISEIKPLFDEYLQQLRCLRNQCIFLSYKYLFSLFFLNVNCPLKFKILTRLFFQLIKVT